MHWNENRCRTQSRSHDGGKSQTREMTCASMVHPHTNHLMNRRRFLQSSLVAILAAVPTMAQAGRRPRILLRNGWQSQNIGDIAHYMGMMELLRRHEIDADVRFWASNMENGAEELFHKHFPEVPCFKDKPSVDAAFQECDFFLHGSSSGFGAWKDAKRWHEETGKPFGVMG